MVEHKDKIKILFVYSSLPSFVKNDLKILQRHFDVTSIQYRRKRDDLVKVARATLENDLTFSWFAVDHAAASVFFSKIFGKKSIVIVGGWDAAFVPEINYGRFTLSWNKRMLTKLALKNADLLLPVSNFTKNEMLEKVEPKKFDLVYNGVNIERFKPSGAKDNKLVITVSAVTWYNLKRKGLETFVNIAKLLPDVKFKVIGKFIDDSIHHLKSISPQNVEFTGFVSENELVKWYQKAKVVCQLSYYEAFGLSPAEGMACNCIPVVTKERAGLPEIVGDAGFQVPYGDRETTVQAIKKALNATDELGEKSRARIKEKFSLQKREEKLVEIIKNLASR